MLKRSLITLVLLAILAAPALAGDDPSPIIKLDARSEVEVDLAMLVDEITPALLSLLTEEGGEESEQAAAVLETMLENLGVRDLDRLHMKARQTKGRDWSRMTIDLAEGGQGSILGRYFDRGRGECRFDEYLRRDDMAVVSVVHDLGAYLELFLDVLEDPALRGLAADLPYDDDGRLTFEGFTPRTDLLPLLSGEFTLAMPSAPVSGPMAEMMPMSMVLALGADDGQALLEGILEIAAGFGGEDVSFDLKGMLAAFETETVGEFELVATPFLALATSDDFLVLANDAEGLRRMLARPAGNLDVPDGLSWSYVNGAAYAELMEMLSDVTANLAPQDTQPDWTTRLYAEYYEDVESMVQHATVKKGSLVLENEVEGDVMSGIFGMVKVVLEELPTIMESMADDDDDGLAEYSAVIQELDAAFVAYGLDHDGRYPADPDELVLGGYLEQFPYGPRVPGGHHMEGGYSYHAVTDAAGEVVGYYLFVYGPDPDGGYDVYTADNLADPASYWMESDGEADGVVTFCLDGVALEQARESFPGLGDSLSD